jgi:membrane-bound lytic murein transglycosylase F
LNATPLESVRAGTTHLMRIDNYWSQFIKEKNERIKFDLASYNVGLGHIIDARNLAMKYGKDADKWENNVAWCLAMKSNSKYYNDPIVKFGYCRGTEPCAYVSDILTRYDHYRNLINENPEGGKFVNK